MSTWQQSLPAGNVSVASQVKSSRRHDKLLFLAMLYSTGLILLMLTTHLMFTPWILNRLCLNIYRTTRIRNYDSCEDTINGIQTEALY